MRVRMATTDDAEIVGSLVYELVTELTAPKLMNATRDRFIETAGIVLSEANVWALLAEIPGVGEVGVITLNECAAIYAGGRFGEVCELYVRPAFRSSGLGAMLIRDAVVFANSRRWKRLEVGVPPQPTWDRTLKFYKRSGFEEIGPRLRINVRST